MNERAAPQFTPGDHLRVWRPLGPIGYYHHGIYIDDGRVIQFGGSVFDKPHATVGAVPLWTFERDRTAHVAPHGGKTWWGAPRFDRIEPEVTVRRAERLTQDHPTGLYDLFGYNCEQAANFCSTNSYESYQVRGYFVVRSLLGVALLLYVAARAGAGRSLPRIATVGVAMWLLGSIPTVLYHFHGARFMRRVGRPLLEGERSQERR
jgi:hypothetical protein